MTKDNVNSEAIAEVVALLGDGRVKTHKYTIDVLTAGLSNFMYEKIKYHVGHDIEDMEAAIKASEAMSEDVANALSHEIDHIENIKDAYALVVEGLDAWQNCIDRNNRAATADTN